MAGLTRLVGRVGLLCVGLIAAQTAWHAWTVGDPPPVRLFGARAIAPVVEARVISGRQNGSLQHVPQVTVAWPPQPTR